ncbi:MAG: radical SAM protein [Planctomycetota bacterium]|nr:MAG: radical SAM protein [Planctomycetota bacterium]
MKVVLVRPNHRSLNHVVMPPLGIGYLSGHLRRYGIETAIVDGLKNKLDFNALAGKILSETPDAVGISCYTSHYNETVLLSKEIKKNNIPCIIGGPHATFLPHQTLLDSNADYVICGEAEIALLALLENNLINNNIKGVYSLSNLKGSDSSIEKAEVVKNLDDIPFPDWESLNPNSYPNTPHGFFNKDYPVGIIMTTRGCPYNCTFCGSPKFYDCRMRYRSPENVIQEIEYLMDNFGVREIHFFDDNLTFKRNHIEKICRLLIENKIKISWSVPDGIRADKIDEELLRLMKRSGCYYVELGIESANPKILKKAKKAETIEQIRKAIELCDKVGIYVGGSFIFGLPGETKETIEETINFSRTTALIKADFLLLDVLPGSELWDTLKGEFVPDWVKFSYREPEFIPEGLSKEQLLEARTRAFKKFYFRPSVCFKIIRLLRLPHIKFILKKLLEYSIVRRSNSSGNYAVASNDFERAF